MNKQKILKAFCDNCGTVAIEGVCPREILGENAKCSSLESFSLLVDALIDSAPSQTVTCTKGYQCDFMQKENNKWKQQQKER